MQNLTGSGKSCGGNNMDQNNYRDLVTKANNRALKSQKKEQRFKSKLTDPRFKGYDRGILNPNKHYSMELFRGIAEKAWLINVIVGHIIDKVIPYLNPLSDKGRRGFEIVLKDPDEKITKEQKKKAKWIQEFLLKTGEDNFKQNDEDLKHEDDLPAYSKKILRDMLVLDQVASEKLWNITHKKLLAFEAIDAATILRCTEEGYDGDDQIKFVQMIQGEVVSTYTGDEIIFEYDNPRTDLKAYGYGYSKIQQCVNLIIASINTFAFNAGSFTEDKLPRGMLLLSGDMGFDEVEEIEDYIMDVMGPDGIAGATKKWGIPIVPTGKSGDKASISWQPLGGTQQEMQYSRWQDFLNMGIAAIWGVDIESTGMKNEKGAKIMESGSAEAHKYSDDKGIGNALTFLGRHYQGIVDALDPLFKIRFIGFEQDDAKELRDATESELKTHKSVNDILRENDMPESKYKFADIPGVNSPQIVQLYMAETNQDQGGEEGEPGADHEVDEFDQGFEDFGKSIKDEVVTIVI